MATDTQIVANIRTMLFHYRETLNHFDLSNQMEDAVLLEETLDELLDGESYDWKYFTVRLLEIHHGDVFLSEIETYKQEIGYGF